MAASVAMIGRRKVRYSEHVMQQIHAHEVGVKKHRDLDKKTKDIQQVELHRFRSGLHSHATSPKPMLRLCLNKRMEVFIRLKALNSLKRTFTIYVYTKVFHVKE